MRTETPRCPVCFAEFPEQYVVNDNREIVGCNYCTDVVDAGELENEMEEDRLEVLAEEMRERSVGE